MDGTLELPAQPPANASTGAFSMYTRNATLFDQGTANGIAAVKHHVSATVWTNISSKGIQGRLKPIWDYLQETYAKGTGATERDVIQFSMKEISRLKMSPSQSLEAFLATFNTLATSAKLTDDQMFSMLTTAVEHIPDLQAVDAANDLRMADAKYKTYEEYVAILQIADLKRTKITPADTTLPGHKRPMEPDTAYEPPSTLARFNAQPYTGQKPHLNRTSPEICFNCKRPGHTYAECQATCPCGFCGMSGHGWSTCKKRADYTASIGPRRRFSNWRTGVRNGEPSRRHGVSGNSHQKLRSVMLNDGTSMYIQEEGDAASLPGGLPGGRTEGPLEWPDVTPQYSQHSPDFSDIYAQAYNDAHNQIMYEDFLHAGQRATSQGGDTFDL
jgi:hypothetical protein